MSGLSQCGRGLSSAGMTKFACEGLHPAFKVQLNATTLDVSKKHNCKFT